MHARTQYGNILLANAPTVAGLAVAHGLNTTDFCVFGTQRVNPNQRTGPRIYCPIGATRTAASLTAIDPGAAANTTQVDLFAVSEHSLLDIGPIAGITRNAVTEVRNARRAFRSLHRGVTIPCTTGAIAGARNVVHRLGTQNVLVFIFPNEDPYDAGVGPLPLAFWATVTDANTVVVRAARQDNGAFTGVVKGSIDVDVMVMTWVNVGHSMPLVPIAGVGGGHYDNNERPSLTHPPSYWAAYHHMTIAAAMADRVHRLLQVPRMALIGATASPGLHVPVWTAAAAPTLDISLGSASGANLLAGNSALIMREYSPLAVLFP